MTYRLSGKQNENGYLPSIADADGTNQYSNSIRLLFALPLYQSSTESGTGYAQSAVTAGSEKHSHSSDLFQRFHIPPYNPPSSQARTRRTCADRTVPGADSPARAPPAPPPPTTKRTVLLP
ncbi:hypothetical protein O988_00351 [Pseudogymnoascus sp. VKM F-3808]|nr:hypothetical protein O988_00351 [Pseudogymnoascus sp. VKM F-3808]